jgi:hypothetical protein
MSKRPAIMITVALALAISAGVLAYAFTPGGSGEPVSNSARNASVGVGTIGTPSPPRRRAAASAPLQPARLTPGQPYTFKVQAINAAGSGAVSASTKAITP